MATHRNGTRAVTPVENFRFSYHGNSQTATVTAYFGSEVNIVIPANVVHHGVTHEVTAIGANAFRERHLQSVQIPNTISSIREAAFQNNQLQHLMIPDSVTHISPNAFRENELTDVVLPSTLEVIEDHVFFRNQLLTIDFPPTLVHIGAFAFSHNALTHMTLPNGLMSIGNSAFSSNRLTQVHIPNSVVLLGSAAFYNNQLTDITLPSGMTQISNSLFYRNRLTHVTIPDTVISIGNNAFRDNFLTHLELPNSVISIGNSAFRSNHLVDIRIPASVGMIGHDAFSALPLTSIYTDAGNATKLTQLFNVNTMRNLSTTTVTLLEGLPFFEAHYINTPLNPVAVVGDHLTFSVDIQANDYYVYDRQTDEWLFVDGRRVPIQWYKDGHELQNENGATLELMNIQLNQAGTYYAVVNGIKLPDIQLLVEAMPEETPTIPVTPHSDFTYHVLREGQARPSLIVTNHSATRIPPGWQLQVNFVGGNPYLEWPATFVRAVGGVATTPVNVALNAHGSVTIPIGDGSNRSIASVRVNGTSAIRE
ncbi:MAG: leucine-rich repeat protein [Defluviitaleaceae bacterium]|nr:leucine-rich repeat protein [Defluviitaleaceae bacterium]